MLCVYVSCVFAQMHCKDVYCHAATEPWSVPSLRLIFSHPAFLSADMQSGIPAPDLTLTADFLKPAHPLCPSCLSHPCLAGLWRAQLCLPHSSLFIHPLPGPSFSDDGTLWSLVLRLPSDWSKKAEKPPRLASIYVERQSHSLHSLSEADIHVWWKHPWRQG